MPFKRDLVLQNIPLSKQSFKTQPQTENEDVTWSPQHNPPTTGTNKRRASSLQEAELDGWFLILHIVLETWTIECMHKFNMSFVFRFYILRLTSWIWTDRSTEGLKLESPSKWNSYEGFNLEHCTTPTQLLDKRWVVELGLGPAYVTTTYRHLEIVTWIWCQKDISLCILIYGGGPVPRIRLMWQPHHKVKFGPGGGLACIVL